MGQCMACMAPNYGMGQIIDLDYLNQAFLEGSKKEIKAYFLSKLFWTPSPLKL